MSKSIEQRIAALERVLKPPRHTDEVETFGERLRRLRKDRNFTMDTLCADIAISKGFLSDLENSKREPGAATLYRLAKALGVSMDYLWTGHIN